MAGLVSKATARERILVVGGSGTGKSTTYISAARKSPDATFYVCDSDFAIDRMLEGENLPNVTHRLTIDWADYVKNVKDFQAQMKPDDWLVIDFISTAWDAVQAYYVDQVHGKDVDAYFLEARKKKAKGNPLDGDTDWGIINKIYKAWMTNLLAKTPGHILATAPAKALGDRDDPAVKALYGAAGVRAEGQKHLAHSFHTVLLLGKTRMGEYQLTTIKDRNRREVEKAALGEFATDYLLKIAGFRPGGAA